jgi:septum formation protein
MLLKQIGIVPDQVVFPDIDETPTPGELPRPYAVRMARAKAAAVQSPSHLVLAADTVVSIGRRILPKTHGPEQVRTCLTLLSGRRHRVMTAVVLGAPNIGAPDVGAPDFGAPDFGSPHIGSPHIGSPPIGSREAGRPGPGTTGGRATERLVESIVTFNRLTSDQIERYVATREGEDKAGGYAINGRAASFIRFLSGSHSAVVGLPLFETAQLLRGVGWQVP